MFIISLDGGGIRAVVQLVILKRLYDKYPDLFDHHVALVAGTSAGAMVGVAVALMGVGAAYDYFIGKESVMERVFSRTWSKTIASMDGYYGATYEHTELLQLCKKMYGDTTLADLSTRTRPKYASMMDLHVLSDDAWDSFFDQNGVVAKSPSSSLLDMEKEEPVQKKLIPHLLVTSFCIDPQQWSDAREKCWHPRIYHTMGNGDRDGTHDGHPSALLTDVLLQTTSAPTFFPSWKGCIDGGIAANNPCMFALTYAIRHRVGTLENTRVLSLGTGVFPSDIDTGAPGSKTDGQLNWGNLSWINYMVDVFMDGSSESASINAHNLLGSRGFYRFQPLLKKRVLMDDVKSIPILMEMAQTLDLSDMESWLEGVCKDMKIKTLVH
jgi:Patatin-like phospholipase